MAGNEMVIRWAGTGERLKWRWKRGLSGDRKEDGNGKVRKRKEIGAE